MRAAWKSFVAWVSRSVTLPGDSESIRIRKTTIAIVSLTLVPVHILFAIPLFPLGAMFSAWFNLARSLVTLGVTVYLFRTRNFSVFGNALMAITLVSIYVLQTNLGGIVRSGLLIGGGLLAAMASALVLSRRAAVFWAAVNVAAITLSLLYEPQLTAAASSLPGSYGVVNGFFNAVWMAFLGMFLVLYLLRELETAQDLADRLLYNVLPRRIAARLKREPGTIAEAHESASVLFADIVGFTPLSTVLSPQELIEQLDRIYSYFDTLVEKYGVEKIRTIGDNYMAAAGVPEPRPDHAQALADLALDMLDYCAQLPPVGGRALQFRIGINSGPLIAGVLGSVKYQYDIWGDTVNTASRMESHGEPGKIQVTDAARALLEEDYVLVPRGAIEVKGKGEMQAWFLTGKR